MRNFIFVFICVVFVFFAPGCNSQPREEAVQTKEEKARQTGLRQEDEKRTEVDQERAVSAAGTDLLKALNDSLSTVAEGVKPSVVNISTTKTIALKEHPFGDFLDDPFFRKFFGDKFHFHGGKRKFKTSALGSGVIFTEDGYILTNNHVVKDVDEIKVILHDKREFTGKIIGSDPKSDLAIVKVQAEGLPAISVGESDKMKVGELVIAIGNPFGLGHTITMGIVSAVGRSNVGIAEYEDFIQTDAAINPGNSGGALVNIRGELIGINTAIFSTSGGHMGIGFAIPSDMAHSIMQSIIKHGKVVRGWLGVMIQNITPDLAKHFNIKEDRGSLITDVVKDGPAEKAGFKRGDVIVEYDGASVEDSTHLRNMVAGTLPDETVTVKVIREGKQTVLSVAIGEMPSTTADLRSTYENVLAGVFVQNLTPEIKKSLNIPQKATGVIVTNIEEDSPASEDLRPNDVIQEINKGIVKNTKDYEDVVSKIGGEEGVLLFVYRDGGYIYVTISP